MTKFYVLTPFQQKYMQLVATYPLGSSPRCPRPFGIRKKSHRNLKMLQLFTSTNGKETCWHLPAFNFRENPEILAKILLNHLNQTFEQALQPEGQCHFHLGCGMTDIIFAARKLQEKYQEQNVNLYTIFVDLTKAFDMISHDGLWKIMYMFCCPERFITLVRELHP